MSKCSKGTSSDVRHLLCHVPLRISNGLQLREIQADAEIVFPPSHVTESCNSFWLPAVKSLNLVYDAVLRFDVISHFNYNHHQSVYRTTRYFGHYFKFKHDNTVVSVLHILLVCDERVRSTHGKRGKFMHNFDQKNLKDLKCVVLCGRDIIKMGINKWEINRIFWLRVWCSV